MRLIRMVIFWMIILFVFKETFDALYKLGIIMGFDGLQTRNRLLLMGHARLWALKYTVLLFCIVIGVVYWIFRKK